MNAIRTCRRSRAFSLIELLVVVAIVLVLVALIVPGIRSSKEAAARAVCLGNLRQLATSSLQYAQDHGGVLPHTAWNSNPALSKRWMHELAPYVNADLATGDLITANAVFRCPKGAAFKQFGRAKTYLGWDYVDYSPVGLYAASLNEVNMPVRLQSVPGLSKVAMIVESNNAGHAALWPGWTWDNIMTTSINETPPPVERHNGGMHIAYCDGHVALVKNPTWNSLGMFKE